jgi:hypothetical protein
VCSIVGALPPHHRPPAVSLLSIADCVFENNAVWRRLWVLFHFFQFFSKMLLPILIRFQVKHNLIVLYRCVEGDKKFRQSVQI